MDEASYSAIAQVTANQPLGGKEIRFPSSGLSCVVPSSRLGTGQTVAAVNVILRSPYSLDKCGGTRPGLRAFSGDQPAPTAPVRWLWPNGEGPILWPNGAEMVYTEPEERIAMPDGGAVFNQHETFSVKAAKGAVPESASAMAWYRDRRIVAAGSMWYASRIGEPGDFDYGGDGTDPSRAVAGNVALAGRKGEAITALAAVADAALFVATARSLWRVSGEITGSLSVVSEHIGIVSRHAWCWDGVRFWFWSDKGLYCYADGAPPVDMTKHLRDYVMGWRDAVLIFDSERNGIHIIGTDSSGAASDWFFDIGNSAMWPLSYPATKRPTAGGLAMLSGKNRVMFLCADGVWRYWEESQATDDGTAIESHLVLGPVTHTTGDTENAFLAELDFEMDTALTPAAGVNISGITGRTSNETADAAKTFAGWVTAGASGTNAHEKFRYTAKRGWNRVVRPRIRCNSFAIALWSLSGRWALSKVTAAHRGCGRIRR